MFRIRMINSKIYIMKHLYIIAASKH